METTACPEPGCTYDAEVHDRFVLESTGGPVEHVVLSCVLGHAQRMPVALLGVEWPPLPR